MAQGQLTVASRTRRSTEFLYGRNPVEEALSGQRELIRLWIRADQRGRGRLAAIADRARATGLEVRETDQRRLDQMTRSSNHQGVVLETGPFKYEELDRLIHNARERTILVLDHLQDPQNLATLIRTAAAVDVAGVVIQSDRSVSVTPAVVRASAGLVERVPVSVVTNTSRALEDIKQAGYWTIALEQGERAADLFTTDLPHPTALVVGSEGSGISRSVLKACDLIVYLPMTGGTESLNAAVAGSVALYELFRQGHIERASER